MINNKVKIWIIIFLLLTISVHLIFPFGITPLDNNLMIILIGFSMAHFIFYFGKIASTTVTSAVLNNKSNKEMLFKY